MRKKTRFRASALLLCAALLLSLSACVTLGSRKPIATLVFSNGKEVRFRLYPDKAPNTVNNFIYLANSGFYDGLPVHRIVEYFVVQMGEPVDKDLPGYRIKGEFSQNGFTKNDMIFEEGTVGMAREAAAGNDDSENYDTASCQFFFTLEREYSLDGYYAAFGKVISGMEHLHKISKMDTDADERPRDEIYISSLRVETYDYKYKEPKKIG